MNKWVLAMMLLAATPGVLAQGGAPPANVRVAVAEVREMAPVSLVPGTVVSRNDALLAAEESGRLERVAEVGTVVVEGDVLAKIEDTALRLRRDELQADIQRADARLTFLRAEERRFERLAESNLAAANQLDQTRSDRAVAEGDLAVARARLAQVVDRLDRTEIRAPFDGVVVERLMRPGERAADGDDVVRIVDPNFLEVIARAPLEHFDYVSAGDALDVQTGDRHELATVRTKVAVGDENTHQFELRLDIDGDLFPVGKTVRVAVPISETREVLSVPRDALVLRPGSVTVYIVNADGQAEAVPVTAGIGSGDRVEVVGAVAPGDQVVIRGNERLQPGQSVNVLEG